MSSDITVPPQGPSIERTHTPVRIRALGARVSIEDLNAIRQNKIRAASAYLLLWWVVIFCQCLAHGSPWLAASLVICCLGATFGLLTLLPKLATVALKVVELIMFGAMIIFFVILQYQIMTIAAATNDVPGVETSIKNGIINALTILLAYTLFIPNSVRTALLPVAVIAYYPLLTSWILNWTNVSVRTVLNASNSTEPYGLNLTMTTVAACLALYGIYAIQQLRTAVFDARRINQYQLGKLLGSGGMGEVYLAEHQFLKRDCAIKLISPEHAGNQRALARLEREVRATAKVAHPNIVQIFDYGITDDGTLYYVMEKLNGLNLDELVRRHGPLSPSRTIYLLMQICDGLGEAHSAGMIHRDLKPANIFAAKVGGKYDVAKVLDFGIVKVLNDEEETSRTATSSGFAHSKVAARNRQMLTIEGDFAGTPAFASPEQVHGKVDLDHRSDLYSLGMVAYYLLTARTAFGQDLISVAAAHTYESITPPSKFRPVPRDLESVVLCCLEKSPADRYPDADSLREALSALDIGNSWNSALAEDWWMTNERLYYQAMIATS